jgi:hypothetical protein
MAAPSAASASFTAAGCQPSRAAEAYHPGGKQIRPAPKLLVPCTSVTGFYTGETGVGVTKQGTVWFSAANWEWQLARSKDDGAHWQAFTVPGPQAEPGCYAGTDNCDTSESGKYNTVADSYLYVDPRTSRIFWSKGYGLGVCSSLSISADNGAKWVPVTQFDCPGSDYGKVSAGPPPAGGVLPTAYPDVVYGCVNGPTTVFAVGPSRVCYKSLDGGVTWTQTGTPPIPSPQAPGCFHFQEPQRVGPDGTLYLPLNCSADTGSNPAGDVRVAISHDEGQTWSYAQVPTGIAGSEGTVGSEGDLIGGVSLDVDRAGNVYVVWPGADDKVYLAVSKDHGQAWRGPLLVSAPAVRQAAAPFAQVSAQAPGHIAIAYYGYTGTSSKLLNGYLTESFDATARNPIFYTAMLNKPSQPLYFPVKSGNLPRNDFLGVTIAPNGTPWTGLVKLLSATPDSQGYIQSTGFAGRLVPESLLATACTRDRRARGGGQPLTRRLRTPKCHTNSRRGHRSSHRRDAMVGPPL